MECWCDARNGDAECTGAFVGRWFACPDLFRLRGERGRGEREFEAIEAFLGERRGGEGFLDEIAELICLVRRGGEGTELQQSTGGGYGGEGEGAGGWVRRVVEKVEVEGGGFTACGAGAALLGYWADGGEGAGDRSWVGLEVA